MNVFLVDDSPIIRERWKRMLAFMEQVKLIGEAGAVPEAVDAILEQKPDLVLLDSPSSNGTGLAMLQRIKSANPAPAVIIMTDDPHPLYRRKCLEAGADFFFDKSSEFEQLVAALEQLIQRASDDGV
jgi:DNA-binding NarL/FixJ family response regulator